MVKYFVLKSSNQFLRSINQLLCIIRPANYKKGIDPEVATVWKTTQLLDPIEDKLIAIWDFTHNAWFFYENFFQIDPDAECCYKLTWDPEVLLFKPKKGNI